MIKDETRLSVVIPQEMKLELFKKCDKEDNVPSSVIRKLIKKYLEEDDKCQKS